MGVRRRAQWMEILGNQVVRLPRGENRGMGRFLGRILAGIGLVCLSGLFSSWVHVQSLALQYPVSQAYRVQKEEIQTRDTLEIQKQILLTPERIKRLAEEELKMVIPFGEHRILVK